MNERDLKDARRFGLIYDHDEEEWDADLLSEEFDTDKERNEWLALHVDLGRLTRNARLAPRWRMTIAGKQGVEEARAAFADRRQRGVALRQQLLVWVDGAVTQTGTLEAYIGNFFESTLSHFAGQQFSEKDTSDAAAYLQQNGLIKRLGASGAPTIRLGITSSGQECVIDFDGDAAAYLSKDQQQSATYNIGQAHAVAIAHGQGSTANAISIQETLNRSVELAQAIRQVSESLDLNAADFEALDDIESREPGRVKRGLAHVSTFAQQSSSGAMGSMLAAGAMELLKHMN